MGETQVLLDDIWHRVKEEILSQAYFEPSIYDSFVKTSSLAVLNDHKAIILVPNAINKIILSGEKEILYFNESINRVLNKKSIQCEIYVENEFKRENPKPPIVQKVKVLNNNGINTEMTFDSFVVGTSNKESHSAALGCAYRPGQYYTPLFIYGNSGLGKTHLLHAIGNYIKKVNPDSNIYYTSSLDFVKQVANAIQNRSIEEFKENMADLDVLLIDDVQFLAGKEKSHEIFFGIFNELIYNKKQIVITSDRHPDEIKGLEDRLISRFHSGLSLGIDSPEFETARAILDMKIKNKSYDSSLFDDEVLDYIATHFARDVRVLEGTLNRLLFYTIEFSKSDHVDLNIAMNALKLNNDRVVFNELDAKTIKRVVADYYNITQSQITSKSRTKVISNARHIAIYLCRKHLDMAYIKIGDEFGKRDHSTIISACDKIEKNIKTDPMLAKAVFELEEKLR